MRFLSFNSTLDTLQLNGNFLIDDTQAVGLGLYRYPGPPNPKIKVSIANCAACLPQIMSSFELGHGQVRSSVCSCASISHQDPSQTIQVYNKSPLFNVPYAV